ncbi:MAG: hypothetical protein WCF57_23515 [Pyrinomonadaceae bacterium]
MPKLSTDLMKNRRIFIRNFEAGRLLESFIVAAVASVLAIRLFLDLTGYPQISGGGLHVAHVLWGGLLMLAAIIILLSFVGRAAERVAAIAGGLGFGMFIDEVGKFVTSDNNYFFRPAVAVIYVMFILIFLVARAIQTNHNYSDLEYLLNALRDMEEVALRDMDEDEKARALNHLAQCDPRNPLVAHLKESLTSVDLTSPPRPSIYARVKRLLTDFYQRIARRPWFTFGVISFFVVQLAIKIVYVFVLLFFVGFGWERILEMRLIGHLAGQMRHLTFIDWADIASSLLSSLFVLCGVLLIRRTRLFAYRMFARSILISIFLTQVFAFYREQFSALLGLVFNIIILVVLRFMIDQERLKAESSRKADAV